MKIAYNLIWTKKTINHVIFGLIFTLFSLSAMAQENPPIPVQVQVNTSQFLNFGAFTVGTGVGTVTVNSDGIRSNNGDTFLLNMGATPSAALFDLTANPGTIIQIQPQTPINLPGSNGGSIKLNIDSFSTGQTFITTASPPLSNPVYVGGTLSSEGSIANPPGNYNGTFTLTFIHQ
ncbi:MAG: DUF4402 domain-containing protein [Bacteroidota bacterium]